MIVDRLSDNEPHLVLVNPYMNVSEGFGRYEKLLEPMPPVGIAYLSAALRKNGIRVTVYDAFAEHWPPQLAARLILEGSPDAICLSCLTPSADYTLELARLIKQARPGVKVILGNLHAVIFAKEILESGNVDVVCHGEGEETIVELAKWIAGEVALESIAGISYFNGTVVNTTPRPLNNDLDTLAFPDWSDLPYEKYGLLPFATVAKPALTVSSSRGCPYSCRFCSLKYLGRKFRLRSPESTIEEIQFLVSEYKARQVGFVDSYFPVNEMHGLEFCEAVQRIGVQNMPSLLTQLRVDVPTKKLMRELKSIGMRRVMFGIESGVQELLDSVKKNFSIADVNRAIRICREVGMETVGFFIFGLPGDTPEYARRTARYSRSLGLDFVKYSIFVPFPGSDIYEQLVEEGVLKRGSWIEFTTFNPRPDQFPYVPPGMTANQLADSQHWSTLLFYIRPSVIFNLAFRVRTIPIGMLWNGVIALLKSAWDMLLGKRN